MIACNFHEFIVITIDLNGVINAFIIRIRLENGGEKLCACARLFSLNVIFFQFFFLFLIFIVVVVVEIWSVLHSFWLAFVIDGLNSAQCHAVVNTLRNIDNVAVPCLHCVQHIRSDILSFYSCL